MILKKILSILFSILSLTTMYIAYILVYMSNPILPTISNILSIVFPMLLILLSEWLIFKTFNITNTFQKGVLTFFILLFLLISTYFGTNMYRNYLNSLFDKEKWIEEPDERTFIVDNMLKRYKLVGMSKEDVTDLLGAPTDTDYFKTPTNYVYCLGPERGFLSIDNEWLAIEFDQSGRVSGFGISTD